MAPNLSANDNGSFPDPGGQASHVPAGQSAPDCGSAIFNRATFDDVVELLSLSRMQIHLMALRELFDDVVASGSARGEAAAGAHKLASQAGMLGFQQLSACAREVENARGRAPLRRELASLQTAMDAASPVLDQLTAEAGGAAVQAS